MNYLLSCLIAVYFLLINSSPESQQVLLSDVTYSEGKYLNDGREITGEIIDYYENDKLRLRYGVVSGRLHGEALTFNDQGQVTNKKSYIFNKLFGEFVDFNAEGKEQVKFKVDLNAYQKGEIVLNLEIRKGKKMKSKGDRVIYFVSYQGEEFKYSEEVSIFDQTKYYINDEKGKLLYKNF